MYKGGYEANPCVETMQRVALAMYMEGFKEGEISKETELKREMVLMQDKVDEAEDALLTDESFLLFWNLYDKKVGKDACLKLWRRLPKRERKLILEYVPLYVKACPDKKYRKNPSTFLRQKAWYDELIPSEYAERERAAARRRGEAEAFADVLSNFGIE